MWASTTDDNAVYEQSDKRMCQLVNTRCTRDPNETITAYTHTSKGIHGILYTRPLFLLPHAESRKDLFDEILSHFRSDDLSK